MEQYCYFVNSRGLLKSCEVRNSEPIRSGANIINLDKFNKLHPGGSIYVCLEALDTFVNHYLNNINVPFTLVTGDSDWSLTESFYGFDKIINNPYLITWYAQNLKISVERLNQIQKVQHLPIGMHYHAPIINNDVFGSKEDYWINPLQQEMIVKNVLKFSNHIQNRIPKAYCNWKASINKANRHECYNKVPKELCVYEESRISLINTWKKQSEYAFIISPEGGGEDCHRHWESLVLGSILIVNKNFLSPLFEGLPVIIVDDWAEISEKFLQDKLNQMINIEFDFSKLFLQYWRMKFRNVPTDETFKDLTLSEFKDTLTSFERK